MEEASSAIAGLDVGEGANAGGDALPGSETQWASRQIATHLDLIAKDISGDMAGLGHAVRGAGDRYEVTDDDLAADFKDLF